MNSGEWFQIASDAPSHAGEWHMSGWMHTAIKTSAIPIPDGPRDRESKFLALAVCPQCSALVIADEAHAYGDRQWAHEDWHHRTDHPHPESVS